MSICNLSILTHADDVTNCNKTHKYMPTNATNGNMVISSVAKVSAMFN